MPRPPARHVPYRSPALPTNPRPRHSLWSRRHGLELKEHLAAKRQIAAALADEAVVASMRADLQIQEEHMAVEATVNASRKDAASRLSALSSSSWCFFAGTVGAYDEPYDVFSQRARAYMNSRSSRLVNHTDHEQGTHDVQISPSSKGKETIIISDDDEE